MFTGIVQTTGTIRSIRPGSNATCLSVDVPDLRRPLPEGASVCVSGVCLTVTRDTPPLVEFDVVPETLQRSTLGRLSVSDRVNLERSLQVGDGLEGHIVQGHVDGTAEVIRIERGVQGHAVWVRADDDVMRYVIPKGSIAVDGVSLTVAEIGPNAFAVALIPTTAEVTTLGRLRVGDRVNVETDIIARTVVVTLQRWRQENDTSGSITIEMLKEQGFV